MPPVSREIYWNVGHGVILPMYILFILTVAIFIYGFYRRWRVYRQGRPLNRIDRIPRRLLRLIQRTFGQLRVLLVKTPGIVHAFLFWFMGVLFIGTLLIMLQIDFTSPFFGVTFLQGTFYKFYSLSLDFAGVVVFGMLVFFGVRRYIIRPVGLTITRDDTLIFTLLTVILVTGYLIEGARMAVTEVNANPLLAVWSPVGLLFGKMLLPMGESSLRNLHKFLWWFHFLLVMGFIGCIPFTKLRHLFTTPINYFFADLREKGSLAFIDLDSPTADHFGASRVADLAWKDIYDADACTSCKRCQERCPAWITDKPLSPMKIVQQIGDAAFSDPEADLVAMINPEAIWACTTCRACEEICPADIEHITKIIEMRRNMVLMEGRFPGDEVVLAVNNLEVNGNPFGMPFAERGNWAEGLSYEKVDEGGRCEILYFAGCYASFDKRSQIVARDFIKICNTAGMKVGILGKMERCCGEPLRKLGNEYLYQQMAEMNIKAIQASGAQKIVTTCPHCFNTLKRDYRESGLNIPVAHYTTFLHQLILNGTVAIDPQAFDCTYHDSCYIGRYQGIFEQPREILESSGARIHEMEHIRSDSFCCGAGGSRILAEEKIGRSISIDRIQMARQTGAATLISNCPFCLSMFEDAIKTSGSEENLKVRDLAEIIVERMKT